MEGIEAMHSNTKSRLVTLGIVALMASRALYAQDAVPPDAAMKKAVETRQAVLKLIDWAWQPVAGWMRKKAPFDAVAFQKSGARIEFIAPLLPEVFATDTRQAANVKTQAREGIWSHMADFKAKADELVKAGQALSAACKSGDQAATMKAARGVGKACSACHDSYKDKDI
jgi:cytochrome c556